MSNQSLATRAVRGAFWTGSGLGVHLIVTLIFFRILNLEDMGYRAAELIIKQIQGNPIAQQEHMFPVTFESRGSIRTIT